MDLHIAHATINITMPPGVQIGAMRIEGAAATLAEPIRTTTIGAPQPPALGAAWPGQGGIYVASIPAMLGMPGRHLVAGTQEAERLKFGPSTDSPLAASQVNGHLNTASLLASSEKHPAARWCADYREDGHADYMLPSRIDLLMAFLQAKAAFNPQGWYWSSTQHSRDYAFAQDFEYGYSAWYAKDNEFRVRAFRTIPFAT